MTKSLSQQFTEATGGCWHEIAFDDIYYLMGCKKCHRLFKESDNPTYFNAADILLRMKEFCGEERYKEFVNEYIGEISYDVEHNEIIYINEKYILTPSLLLEKAVEYLRKENENE